MVPLPRTTINPKVNYEEFCLSGKLAYAGVRNPELRTDENVPVTPWINQQKHEYTDRRAARDAGRNVEVRNGVAHTNWLP